MPQLDYVILSHLRWDFVYQRPQHLLSRAAASNRVFFVEEPVHDSERPSLVVERRARNLFVATPHLPRNASGATAVTLQRELLRDLFELHRIDKHVLWYYTPMALPFSRHLTPKAIVYDCMDQLSAFQGAPRELSALERELFAVSDIVFTGGRSLYDEKRTSHPNVHLFPSSVDVAHFAKARRPLAPPPDQVAITGPRIGYCGVIDERMDLELLAGMADLRPDWNFVMVGPVVKVDPAILPQRKNIHYVGGKAYKDLPAYLAGWDAAMMPFAKNDSTRFISPTKTPEYLAAGRPVVSTTIADVVEPYGRLGLARIADSPESFVSAISEGIASRNESWLAAVDKHLATMSWNTTWAQMAAVIDASVTRQAVKEPARQGAAQLQQKTRLAETA